MLILYEYFQMKKKLNIVIYLILCYLFITTITLMLRENVKDKDVNARKMFCELENSPERKILHYSFPD